MNEPVRLLALGAVPWIRTQALYHALAELMTEDAPDTIILARPREPYVCVGYHQPLNAVLDLAACRAAGAHVTTRTWLDGTFSGFTPVQSKHQKPLFSESAHPS